jgi:hypothetical protein
MKRPVLHLIILVLTMTFYNFESTSAPFATDTVAKIRFQSHTIDYDKIVQHSDGTRIFKFENFGEAPLLITHVKTTCGCTVPSYSKDPILPGETGSIRIQYNTKRLGQFNKTILVLSNAASGTSVLKIKGRVVPSQS